MLNRIYGTFITGTLQDRQCISYRHRSWTYTSLTRVSLRKIEEDRSGSAPWGDSEEILARALRVPWGRNGIESWPLLLRRACGYDDVTNREVSVVSYTHVYFLSLNLPFFHNRDAFFPNTTFSYVPP